MRDDSCKSGSFGRIAALVEAVTIEKARLHEIVIQQARNKINGVVDGALDAEGDLELERIKQLIFEGLNADTGRSGNQGD